MLRLISEYTSKDSYFSSSKIVKTARLNLGEKNAGDVVWFCGALTVSAVGIRLFVHTKSVTYTIVQGVDSNHALIGLKVKPGAC